MKFLFPVDNPQEGVDKENLCVKMKKYGDHPFWRLVLSTSVFVVLSK
jgi:hypothetical protein